MPNQSSPPVTETDLVQAFQDVLQAERTAMAMESQLAALERRIDDLLATVDLPTELAPSLLGEGLRNGSDGSQESDDVSSENRKLEKGEEASGNKTEKGSK